MEEEKYIALLYEKMVYDVDNSIFIFKPLEVIEDCYIDFENDILTTKTNKNYLSMEDEVLAFSEETLCYGYPLSQSSLEEQFSDSEREEQIKDYYNSLKETVVFGVYSKKDDRIKTILAPKDELVNLDSDDWFFDFEFDYFNDEQYVNIPPQALIELTDRIDNGDYETVRNYLDNVKNLHEKFINGELIISPIIEDLLEESKEKPIEEKENKKSIKEIKKSLESTLSKLDELIGLENVKREIDRLLKYLIYIKKTKDIVNIEKPLLHMLFTGNPGTGKTTIARLISDLLYEMGYLKNNKFAEITPKDLIAQYVGQTAPKTAAFIKKYSGGVIFIDEAYVFAARAQEFADEAIVEIIKEMEKNETVFIFAGYKEEMKNFVKSNPGIASRLGYFIHYEDFSVQELYNIFELKVKKANLKIDPLLKTELERIFTKVKNHKHFGNGRFVNKLFEKILLEHSVNTEKLHSKEKLITLNINDVNDSLVDEVLYDNHDEMFKDNNEDFENTIGQIAELKSDQYIEDFVGRVIMEKLYDSSYDQIASVIEKRIQDVSPKILDELKKNVKSDQKVKRKEENKMGFLKEE